MTKEFLDLNELFVFLTKFGASLHNFVNYAEADILILNGSCSEEFSSEELQKKLKEKKYVLSALTEIKKSAKNLKKEIEHIEHSNKNLEQKWKLKLNNFQLK